MVMAMILMVQDRCWHMHSIQVLEEAVMHISMMKKNGIYRRWAEKVNILSVACFSSLNTSEIRFTECFNYSK